jgi:hypothetical protein
MLRDIITGLAVWTIVAIELAGAIVLIRRQNRRRETEQKKRCGKVSINRKPINLQAMPPDVIPVARSLMRFWIRTDAGHYVLVNIVGSHRQGVAEVFEQLVPAGTTVEVEPDPLDAWKSSFANQPPSPGAPPCP